MCEHENLTVISLQMHCLMKACEEICTCERFQKVTNTSFLYCLDCAENVGIIIGVDDNDDEGDVSDD